MPCSLGKISMALSLENKGLELYATLPQSPAAWISYPTTCLGLFLLIFEDRMPVSQKVSSSSLSKPVRPKMAAREMRDNLTVPCHLHVKCPPHPRTTGFNKCHKDDWEELG